VSDHATRLLADQRVGEARVEEIVRGIGDHSKTYRKVEEIVHTELDLVGARLALALKQHVSSGGLFVVV
jgi:hypothetical protein